MKDSENSGEVKIGDEYYTWQYDEKSHLFEAWNKDKMRVSKQKMTDEEFEKLSVAAYIKSSAGK